MTDDLQDLKRRLVVGHKSDGRSVYDAGAKAELVALCRQPGASVSHLARECGINANQVSRWLREHGGACARQAIAVESPPSAFVQLPLPPAIAQRSGQRAAAMDLQARLPNGVAIELRGLDLGRIGEVIEALGRLRCSASSSN